MGTVVCCWEKQNCVYRWIYDDGGASSLFFLAFVYSLYSTYLHSFTYHVPLARFYFTSSSFPSKCTFTLKLTHTFAYTQRMDVFQCPPASKPITQDACWWAFLSSSSSSIFISLVVHFYLFLSRAHTLAHSVRCSSAELFQCNVNRIWNRTKWHFNLHVRFIRKTWTFFSVWPNRHTYSCSTTHSRVTRERSFSRLTQMEFEFFLRLASLLLISFICFDLLFYGLIEYLITFRFARSISIHHRMPLVVAAVFL